VGCIKSRRVAHAGEGAPQLEKGHCAVNVHLQARIEALFTASGSRRGRRDAAPAPRLARFLDQRKELSLLKPNVCVKQFPRRIQRLSIDDAQWGGGRTFFSGEGLFLVKLSGPGTVLVSSYGAMGGVE
jgi:hypothetical protein